MYTGSEEVRMAQEQRRGAERGGRRERKRERRPGLEGVSGRGMGEWERAVVRAA